MHCLLILFLRWLIDVPGQKSLHWILQVNKQVCLYYYFIMVLFALVVMTGFIQYTIMDFLLSKYGLIFTEFDSIDRGIHHHTQVCLSEGNRSSFVKITSTWNIWPTFLQNFPPAKITTFTAFVGWMSRELMSYHQKIRKECTPKLVLFSCGGNFREEDKSAKNMKITPTQKCPRLQY